MNPSAEIQGALRRLRWRGVRRWGSGRAVVAVTVVTTAGSPAVLLTPSAGSANPHPGEFALPGGQADRWESVSAAARRRLAEQLGMRLPVEIDARVARRLRHKHQARDHAGRALGQPG